MFSGCHLTPRRSWGHARFVALKRLIKRLVQHVTRSDAATTVAGRHPIDALALGRKGFLRTLAVIPPFGGIVCAALKKQGWQSHEARILRAHLGAFTVVPARNLNSSSLKDLKGQVPHAKIGNQEFSRVMLGGNLIGGWAHARDLIYADKLVKAYHTRDKVFETLVLAEKCGFNCQFLDITDVFWQVEYYRHKIGNFKFIIQANNHANRPAQKYLDAVKHAIDTGASGFYLQGIERFLKRKQYDLISRALELGRRNGVPVGFGSHYIGPLKEALARGLVPDFWMKTLHHSNYWSANPALKPKDNAWCEKAEDVIAFMKELKQPWIAFKTLAAGAIHPRDGIHYAFANGADFACVGMFDFQVVENANIACEILNSDLSRERPWIAKTI